MPKKGWVAVRDLPGTKTKTLKEVFDQFKANYKLCDCCKGAGFTVDDHQTVYEGVSSVRVNDSEALKTLQDNGTLNKGTFERIIETLVHNRKICDKCNGFGFVKKPRKKKRGKGS